MSEFKPGAIVSARVLPSVRARRSHLRGSTDIVHAAAVAENGPPISLCGRSRHLDPDSTRFNRSRVSCPKCIAALNRRRLPIPGGSREV